MFSNTDSPNSPPLANTDSDADQLGPRLTVHDFVQHHQTIRDDHHCLSAGMIDVNTLLRGVYVESSAFYPRDINLGVESDSPSDQDSIIPYTLDIDSFFFICPANATGSSSGSKLPIKSQNWSLYARPNYDFSIKNNTSISTFVYRSGEFSRMELSACTNFLFAKVHDTNINIFLPGLFDHYKNNDVPIPIKSFITQEHHADFVDQILLPACRVVFDTEFYPFALDYKHAARNGISHVLTKISSRKLNKLIREMRRIVACLGCPLFADFFFVIYSHGIKEEFPRILPPGYSSISHYGLRHQFLDFRRVDHTNLYVDLAITFKCAYPQSISARTGLWSNYETILRQFFGTDPSIPLKGNLRQDSFCNFTGLGGFKYREKGHDIKHVQAYGTWKHAFFRRDTHSNRQGKDFSSLDVFNRSISFDKLFKTMIEDTQLLIEQECRYGARLEFRLRSKKIDQLMEILFEPTCQRALYNCIQWHDTASLFKLTMYRLKALHFMRDYLARAIPRHSAEFLSSCVYISFLMSTIYHREMNDESRWRKVAEVFDRCRNSSSSLLFFKDLVDPVSLRFNVNLSRRTLSHHFTRDLVDSCSKSIPTQPSLPAAASEPIISNDNQSTSLIPNVLLAENASIVAVKQALCGILVNSNFPNFNLVHHMKLEDDNDFPRILTRHADASYTNWCCCHNLFACFSLDNDNLIKNFVNLLLDEYLRTRRDNTWDSYLVDGVTKDDLLAFSHNLFKHNNLFTYLLKSKVDIIAFKKHIIWFQNLLPSPERIRQDYAAFKRRSPWLRLQYRAFYIRLVHKNPDVDFGNFTDRCLDYLVANDYRYFPKSDASSKLWYNSSKGLQFHRIPTSAELAEFRQQNVNSI